MSRPLSDTAGGACTEGMSDDKQNMHGVPGEYEEADTASGGAPDSDQDDTTTDDDGTPVDNPSGG